MAEDQEAQHRDFWDILKIIGGSIIVPLVVGTGAYSVNNALKERDVRVRMVELALDVLKRPAQPSDANDPMRQWATNLINQYSGVALAMPKAPDAFTALSTKASAAAIAGYAHVELVSDPPGALVWLSPYDFSEVRIPAPTPTPSEMNIIAASYIVTFKLETDERKVDGYVHYNTNNRISVSFKK